MHFLDKGGQKCPHLNDTVWSNITPKKSSKHFFSPPACFGFAVWRADLQQKHARSPHLYPQAMAMMKAFAANRRRVVLWFSSVMRINKNRECMHVGEKYTLRAPLKPIYENLADKEWVGIDGQEECSTTPNGEEVRFCKYAMQAD
jgi:hypothetical protein